MRNAGRRTSGFWCQHSFISLDMPASNCKRLHCNYIGFIESERFCTYRIWAPAVGYRRSIVINADHFAHILKAGIHGHHIIEWNLIFLRNATRNSATTNFPQHQAESVDIRAAQGLKAVHVNANKIMQCNRILLNLLARRPFSLITSHPELPGPYNVWYPLLDSCQGPVGL